MNYLARAPGKMILLGEYAVLEGARSLVAAVARYAKVTISSHTTGQITISSPTLDIPGVTCAVNDDNTISFTSSIPDAVRHSLQFATSAISSFYAAIPRTSGSILPAEINIDTNAFYHTTGRKLGLGSSAAMTVALFAGLTAFMAEDNEIRVSREDIFARSIQAHRRAQGKTGSGVDIAASSYGGILCYRAGTTSNPDGEILPTSGLPEDLFILPIWTGTPASTGRMIRCLESYKNQETAAYNRMISRLIRVSEDGAEFFLRNRIPEFLEQVEKYYFLLGELGSLVDIPIISPEHAALQQIIRQAGGIYKPSGAGGGDLGVAFMDSRRLRDEIIARINHSPYELLPCSIDREGVRVSIT